VVGRTEEMAERLDCQECDSAVRWPREMLREFAEQPATPFDV
jgi:hypothetical protein